ncbi:SGNH/GDSL hydrolase family protein [Pseudogemmobacter sp. W21_MBD1_M6]|uniref:SGNH/GDSL hydrolase family protein n=1 Tax=Pseudogemmobacter sp. W21_MBD1_M6 TaxID=3240271 RepID=UPI003F9E85AD
MLKNLISFAALLLLTSCVEPMTGKSDARILVMGDSMMAFNGTNRQSVADAIEASLGEEVIDRAVTGARYFYYLPISGSAGVRITEQYRPGKWEWVVLNGGGNDLLFGCGCGKCDTQLDRLVSADGQRGAIPAFVSTIRASGAKVIYTGYLRNPGVQSPIKACRPVGDELDRRLGRMALRDAGVEFLSIADLVPNGDRSYHQIDLIHPSVKGSRAIGKRIARRIVSRDHNAPRRPRVE